MPIFRILNSDFIPLFKLLCGVFTIGVVMTAGGLTASAASDPAVAGVCDAAARRAARDQGIPLDVLRAITRTETGRSGKNGLQPWPWTVNMEGAGKWFDTQAEAKRYVDAHFKRGARSFDVGCFQINYRWHGHAFETVDQMFDPVINAQYAARFLMELYAEFGDWSKAAGAFHSRTPQFANRYATRFDRIRAGLAPVSTVASLPKQPRRAVFGAPLPLIAVHNPAPLVRPGSEYGRVRLGSLMPMNSAAPRALIPLN